MGKYQRCKKRSIALCLVPASLLAILFMCNLRWPSPQPSTAVEHTSEPPSTSHQSEEYTAAALSQLAMPSAQQAGAVPREVVILFINMDRRPDRRKRIEQQFSDLFAARPSQFAGWRWQRMPGVVPSPTLRQEYTPFVVGTMGCTMSHIAALSLVESPAEQVLVVIEGNSTHVLTF